MTLFLIHDKESGRIQHASKVYAPTDEYVNMLNEHGHTHVKVRTSRLVSPDEWYIRNMRPRIRPRMPVVVSRTTIGAGESDSVVFTGLPHGVQFKAFMGGFNFQDERIEGTELEFSVPVPCICQVSFELWPYQTFRTEIEVIG